ncbi:MAG: RNA pseudouridine synthase [Saprospiraceae bacterium]|nr:RNA pseudouridine synthase [Saprospiraceae bacterium]
MTILAETPQWIAINKPAGLVVERDRHGYPSVEEEVLAYLKQRKREPYVGIVHRLDRPVSGVLLLAKKKSALKQLNEQFRQRQVQKVYWAVVETAPQRSGIAGGLDTKGRFWQKGGLFKRGGQGRFSVQFEL